MFQRRIHRPSARPLGRLAAALLLVSWPALASGQQPAAAAKPATRPAAIRATKITTVEGITEYRLPNGLQVLLIPDQSKPTTTVNITYFVGSRHEAYGETGMAHLLEHLLFKGSKGHPKVGDEMTQHGADFNGTTWYDRTNYFEIVSATPQNLLWALDLEADRMVNSFVAGRDLESEMTVVRNEFELGENDPAGVLEERVFSTAYLWHNYGKSTIGARSDIENVPIPRLQAFYRKYYQPDNAMLVVAGKFDPLRTLALIEQKFGRIPRPTRSEANRIYNTYTLDPAQDGERSVTLRRVGDVQVMIAGYHVPAGSDADFPAISVLTEAIGSAPGGRLYKALVDTKLAARVSASSYQLREPSLLLARMTVRQEDSLGPARDAFLKAMDEVVTTPLSEEEVERAKGTLLKNIELSLTQTDGVGIALSEWASRGDWRLIFINRDRIRQVTAADVQRVARTYIKPDNRTLGTFYPTAKPDRVEIPPLPDVAALVKGYKGDTTMVLGEAFDPSPANIDQRTTRTKLASGMQLALLPKETRGRTVNAVIQLHFGTEANLNGRANAAGLAGRMLMRGTTTRTRQEIKDEFDRLKTRVSVNGGPEGADVVLETTRDNLPAALRLVGEVLRQPRWEPQEWETLKRERLAALEEQRSEPIAQAQITYARALQPYGAGHPRYVPTLEERIAEIRAATLDDSRRFYAEFYGVGNGELAVVGDFDPKEVTEVATAIFGDWKSPAGYARIRDQFKDVPGGVTALETPDKANAILFAGSNLPVADTTADYPSLAIADYIFGGSAFDSRLMLRIRQKEGLSYGVGSSLDISSQEPASQLMVYAISAPENTEKVEAAVREELDRAVRDGFTPEEISKAKSGYLQQRQLGRADDGSLAGQLADGLFLGRAMAWDGQLEQELGAVTKAQVDAAFRKYVLPSKLTVVKAGDFAKGKAAPANP
ncbi:MAG TPA: pitrilysin family protein [Gemmatimonadales bacterium]|nr:pitrilysin family protein [Gemmatimonadales bacterium]